ncbi:RND superfamily putative drug exporter [Bacillus oleivorans]|uniref:RND superfamily putative drug exporter n=1 Tax=Bacillus oleivorans TaxID=1448271 RepID=A0A285CQY7_9BACI|nr:MMPL family transporter [Bacillus oleivorans]SNX69967.1 RND superfamily putative drug exporter [Bacillus oleivorans]
MRAILKGKWFVIIAWISVTFLLFVTSPNMADLVREKGQIAVPDGMQSTTAQQILAEVQEDEGSGETSQVALAFHSEEKLTAKEIEEAERAIQLLNDHANQIGITNILTHFTNESLESELVSKDGKTILASIEINMEGKELKEVSEALYDTIDSVEVDHDYTSEWMINEDLVTNSQEGLKKTEGITVVFILVVLLLVFRSAVTPFIPLITVGFSYLVSQSIVAFLVDTVDFPLSTFTQIFLVAILFGIGTDYCILLLSRFKEELAHNEDISEAIITTYRNAGRTVLFSGLAVLVGFSTIGLSTFKLYQSAAAVAIGVLVLLVALFTIVPFFMAILGKKLFWPAKGSLEHKESKIWGAAGNFSLRRPLISLILVAAVAVPFLLAYDGDLSFNSLEEMPEDVASVKAFNIIADSFGPGESMATQVVIKNDEAMNSNEYIGLIEEMSRELEKIDYVEKVRSVTRPTGEPIEDLYVSNQAEVLGNGLEEGNKGIQEISEGLDEATSQLSGSEPDLVEATNGIEELISGTNELKAGMEQLQNHLGDIEQGLRSGAIGSNEIKQGLEEIKASAEELLEGSKTLLAGYEDIEEGLTALEEQYQGIGEGLSALSNSLVNIDQYFTSLESNYEGIAQDPDYNQLKTIVLTAKDQSSQLSAGLNQLNGALAGVSGGINEANRSFQTINNGNEQLVSGMNEVIAGIEELNTGLEAAADGQEQIVDQLPAFTEGLTGINGGQQQILDGFSNLGSQMSELTNGLDMSVDGLNQVASGLGSAQDYLTGIASNDQITSVYIPEEVLNSEEFEESLDAYMSNNRKVVTFDVVFGVNPYSNEAINQIETVESTIKTVTKDTKLENAEVAIGGVSSSQADLNEVSDADYTRTVVLMLAGIFLVLVILLKSFIMPVYLIGSLIFTYFTSMAITEVVFVNILGYTGISWAVPFFGFVILIALGIDYSIFLMDRFNENRGMSVEEALLLAMRKMGTVIISAAIILGGTFAAMMPSGVLSLLEIATITLTGLILYAVIVLPLLVPVMVKTFGKANWWPFIN